MAGQGRPAAPLVAAAEMAAREQTSEVQDGACNGLMVREGAYNGLTVHEVACNGLTVQDGGCIGLAAQKGSGTAGGAAAESTAAESTLLRALEAEEVRRQGHRMVEFIADYLQGVADRPVCSTVQFIAQYLQRVADRPVCSSVQATPPSLPPPSLCPSPPPVCIPLYLPLRHLVHRPPSLPLPSSRFIALIIHSHSRLLLPHISPPSHVPSPSTPHLSPPLVSAYSPFAPSTALHCTADISSAILPGITHWQSPCFFAFFSSPTSAAAICADALISALNVVGFSWAAAPAATELEEVVMDWMVDLLGLPEGFHSVKSGGQGGGVIHGTASEALLVALLAARRRVLDRIVGQAGSVEEAAAADSEAAGSRHGAQEKKRAAEGRLITHLNEAENRLIWRIVSARNGRHGCNGSVGVTHEEWPADAAGEGDGDGTGASVISTTSSIGARAGQAASISGRAAGGSKAAAGACEQGEAAGVPWGSAEDRAAQRLVAYVSDQTHACALKACRVAGMPEGNVRVLPTTAASAYALTPCQLLDAVQRDEAAGLIPFFLVLTVGSTSSTAVDPIAPLAAIAKAHGMWVHVDAAYAGMACMCAEMRHRLAGVHLADSLASNAHKWLLTSFDCCCMWTQDSRPLVKALSILPEYLRNKESENHHVVDYKDWEIPIGRRFRSLKLWMVLRTYGAEGIRAYIRRHMALAEWFEEALLQDDRFQLMAPRPFALVCFRLKPPAARTHSGVACGGGDEGVMGDGSEDAGRKVNAALLEAINSSRHAYLTHTVLSGQYTLRMAIGAVKTEMAHVQAAWRLIQTKASELLEEVKFTRNNKTNLLQ
ncbi:unnamed protein product [Closterium sp. Naga37s-1]|nr:unnamed protein product [Closterium sp. Naga37s-1]